MAIVPNYTDEDKAELFKTAESLEYARNCLLKAAGHIQKIAHYDPEFEGWEIKEYSETMRLIGEDGIGAEDDDHWLNSVIKDLRKAAS